MAGHTTIWGLDIGLSALKALKLSYDADSDELYAEEFDYIEHAKILSQPDADPDQLIATTLETFITRNEISGTPVAISVPGQSGLVKFVDLPPIPDEEGRLNLVQYEARSQIPFPLEEVVWDSHFLSETSVGIFAMRRDQVYKQLAPTTQAGIEVSHIQLTPMALFNCIAKDRFNNGRMLDEDDEQAELTETIDGNAVVVDIGADNTNLIVTDGIKVWQRNIPIGGNHFTRALSKEMKLTFSEAEHMKRNATKAQDPKKVFQSMRPVFKEFLGELQRSIGYYANVNRSERIGVVLGMGGGFRLTGLQKYLSQNLDYEVQKVDSFASLQGDTVTSAPAFQKNASSFASCYGLCLQGLGQSQLASSLLPPEIQKERLVREKKPWALATAAMVLLGSAIAFCGSTGQFVSTHESRFTDTKEKTDSLSQKSRDLQTSYDSKIAELQESQSVGEQLTASVDNLRRIPEMLRMINQRVPRDPNEFKDLALREEISLSRIDVAYHDDLSVWWESWFDTHLQAKLDSAEIAEDDPRTSSPTGSGFVFTLDGFHFHNNRRDPANSSGRFLDSRLLSRLNNLAPFGLQAAFTTVLSISNSEIPETSAENDDQDEQTRGLFGTIGGNRDEEEQEEENTVSQHTRFRVTLVWQPQKGTAPGGALSATTNP